MNDLRPLKTTKIKGENNPEKEEKPETIGESKPLNKEQVQKQLEVEGEDEQNDPGFDPELQLEPAVIFDSELHFIKKLKAVDIVFLIDTTGSMSLYMKGVKRFIRKVVWDAQKCLTQYLLETVDVLLVGLVAYRDHDQDKKTYVSQVICELTSDFNSFTEKLMKTDCKGGKDEPEAVLDGLNDAANSIQWRENSFKFLYHILDAPPHGKYLNNCKNDDYQDCPCGLNYEEILGDLKEKEINYTIIKLTPELDLMINEFSQIFNFEVLDPEIKKDKSKEMSQD